MSRRSGIRERRLCCVVSIIAVRVQYRQVFRISSQYPPFDTTSFSDTVDLDSEQVQSSTLCRGSPCSPEALIVTHHRKFVLIAIGSKDERLAH